MSSGATLGLNGLILTTLARLIKPHSHIAFVTCNKSDIYGLVAHTVLFLNSAGLYFTAQEAPKCVLRMRAVEANREPSARRRGKKARS